MQPDDIDEGEDPPVLRRVSLHRLSRFAGRFPANEENAMRLARLTRMLFMLPLLPARIAAADPSQCDAIATLELPHTTITSTRWVAAGPMAPETAAAGAERSTAAPPVLPAHCRVAIVMKPSSDSHIEAEVWLPAEWNGKFQAVGNGGWAGSISYTAMARALEEGYATASTDTGHKGANSSFAIGHPEKLIDFGYRAVHEMTVQSKAIIAALYKKPARLSYWNGCSTGGRQGLMSAQRYPDDFDAILAGAPANNHSRMQISRLAVSVPTARDAAAAVPPAKLAMVNRAVLAACDAADGVRDGFLNDPRACTFDVATLQCTGADTDACLTAPQVATMKRAYAPVTLANGELVFPGKAPGSETAWGNVGGTPDALSVSGLQIAYADEARDPKSFDLARDLPLVLKNVGYATNAIDPDLKAFKARGGKLLLYHGWNDGLISPGNTVDYFEAVTRTMGKGQDDFVRLFMMPGVGHCRGGAGPDQVNWMGALERWRESGKAPDRIEAARVAGNRVEMTRPLCPYPQIAKYSGIGSINDAQNFACVAKQ
jgi:feruloyl esterase